MLMQTITFTGRTLFPILAGNIGPVVPPALEPVDGHNATQSTIDGGRFVRAELQAGQVVRIVADLGPVDA